MKQLFTLTLLMLIASAASAQQQTLLDGNVHSGGFGGPSLKLTQLNEQPGFMVGGSGAWLVGHSFILGASGYGLVNDVHSKGFGADTTLIGLGYAGGIIGFQFYPDNLVHVGLQTLIGGGGVGHRVRREDAWGVADGYYDFDFDDADAFFVIEPGLNAELNITKNIHLNLETSYRFVSGVEIEGVSDAGLSGPSASMTLKFGVF